MPPAAGGAAGVFHQNVLSSTGARRERAAARLRTDANTEVKTASSPSVSVAGSGTCVIGGGGGGAGGVPPWPGTTVTLAPIRPSTPEPAAPGAVYRPMMTP